MTSKLPKFHAFGGVPMVPFKEVASQLKKLDLEDEALGPADTFLLNNRMTSGFLTKWLQPVARAKFFSNLDKIRGITAFLAAKPSEITIEGGNWQLPDRLIKLSGASLHLGLKVTKISRASNGRYILRVATKGEMHEQDCTNGVRCRYRRNTI